ncbi:zf-HC2 domain-containing protein [Rhodoferax sediminis]|uniref:Zf-HC2 domain-containing protein n=1 Tax=Rhodoferax sediminis TaxID=2509614 RepID=A0A515D7M4_9BURK|nr:zf-HC2 domain-containing protein [Rhodoferax sediminis]QDL36424.1 zf-HC2 domain-containing protein [Rhodoferax sediminis]
MNWMHSCKKVAELLSQRLDEPLGLIDSLRLRIHLSMCDNCGNVDKQMSSVNALAADLFSGGGAIQEDAQATQHSEATPTSPA